MNQNLTITIGITTCYAGESLLQTVQSIRSSTFGQNVRFIIQADRTPISDKLYSDLKAHDVEVYWNTTAGSQFKKIKQIIDRTDSDLFIFTQDDILFTPHAIEEIVKTFQSNPAVTMAGSRILPLEPQTKVETILTSMVRLVDRTAGNWNNGNNFLAASGRCLAFRTSLLKQFRIPENIVNGDMYLYLENKRLNGQFMRADSSIVYIRCPQRMKDHIGPSSRFQYSETELLQYFEFDIRKEYKIPVSALMQACVQELVQKPFSFVGYLGVLIYTRFFRQPVSVVSNTVWDVDSSTKKIHPVSLT